MSDHKTIEISQDALRLATKEQLDRVAVLLAAPTAKKITVTGAFFGLPEDYLTFNVEYEGGHTMNGGIDIDGSAST